jgi:outer membrane lipoprotein-sorting protein
MLRRILIATAALAAGFATVASAQTVDDIINKSIASRGGLEKIRAIQTLRLTGHMSIGPGMEAPLVMEMRRPNQMKMSFTLQGMTGTQAYDGKMGWMVMPFGGKKDPEQMSADDVKEFVDQADIDGPLVDYKVKGNAVELLGKEQVEGTDAYKVKITLKSGNVRTVYIDADSYLEIKDEGKRTMRGTEVDAEGTTGDYKPVNGVLFPFSMENGIKGQAQKQKITIDSIEVNPKLASDDFTMPAKSDSASAGVKAGDAPKHKAEPAGDAKAPAADDKATKPGKP